MQPILRRKDIQHILTTPSAWRLIYRGCEAVPLSRPSASRLAWLEQHQHRHSCLDIMLVLQGRSWYALDRQLFNCNPGTIFIFPPHQPHPCGYPPGLPDFTHLWIGLLHDQLIARIFTNRGKRRHYSDNRLPHTSLAQCGLSFPPLLPEDAAPAGERRLRFTALVAALLAGVVAASDRSQIPLGHAELQAHRIRTITRHIQETGGRDADLDHLAHLAGYSKFHFSRIFKNHTGMTVHDYVNRCRRRKADDLRRDGLSMKEIAYRLGFASPSAFSHWMHQD